MPPLIFLNRLGMFSSSKGREPHSSAYRMTPQLHTSTSGPEYSFPEMTCGSTECLGFLEGQIAMTLEWSNPNSG